MQKKNFVLSDLLIKGVEQKFWHLINHLWLLRPNSFIFQALGYYRENPNTDIITSPHLPTNLKYAYGYFQNYNIVNLSWHELKHSILTMSQSANEQIKSRFSLDFDYTAIHLRKYPTVGHKFTSTHLSNLSKEYFLGWRKKFSQDRIVVLTENHLEFKNVIDELKPDIVIDSKNSTAWETLSVLGGAKRLLASNSTLSWWGSWLSHQQKGEVWLPESWSFWNNVDTSKLHFPGCNTWPSIWDNSGFTHL